MRKLLFFLITIMTINFAEGWQRFEILLNNFDKVQPGDIIVLKKTKEGPFEFGHMAYINKEKKAIDFKFFGMGYCEGPIYTLSDNDRPFRLFRYKKMNKELLDKIEEDLLNWNNKLYDVIVPFDESEDRTYCSHFVYEIFKNGGKKLGKNIEIVKSKGAILAPYDFLDSDELYEVEF